MESPNAPISNSKVELEELQLQRDVMNSFEEFTNKPYKPGWNDPPQQSYDSLQTTINKPRNFLKKRVPFPLAGKSTTSLPQSISECQKIPPLPINVVINPTSSKNVIEDSMSQNTTCIDSESTLEEVMIILTTLLGSSSELGTKINDIKKRISKMEDMWANKKLDVQVQVQMSKLAKALQDGDTAKADDIHKALMVDHVSEVCTWMPGIKQLIYHCTARAELMAIDKD